MDGLEGNWFARIVLYIRCLIRFSLAVDRGEVRLQNAACLANCLSWDVDEFDDFMLECE